MVASSESPPTEFQPADGCTDATDFVVRCFVARLRSGIVVKKHGRKRGAKSGNRALFIHPDGVSLSWKHEKENSLSGNERHRGKNPRLDLRTCLEVRHARTVDPLEPRFTGTALLRKKSNPDEVQRSFSLIFPERTLDLTACSYDQCQVLVQGFSALCYRLQLAVHPPSSAKKTKRSNPKAMYIEFDNLVHAKFDESSSGSSYTHLISDSSHSDLYEKSPRLSEKDAIDASMNVDGSISLASLREACDVSMSSVLHGERIITWF